MPDTPIYIHTTTTCTPCHPVRVRAPRIMLNAAMLRVPCFALGIMSKWVGRMFVSRGLGFRVLKVRG